MQSLFGEEPGRLGLCRDAPDRNEKQVKVLATVVERNVSAQIVSEIDLARAGNFLLRIQQHLFPLRDPARSARNSKKDWEHRHGEAHRLINETRVEIHIGIEPARNEVFVLERDAFAFERNLDERVAAHYVENFIRDVLYDFGSRIIILVHTMAETHQ